MAHRGVAFSSVSAYMGVYCFRWKNGPWLKVGHYHRRNPWSRFAHRGWSSVITPDPAIEFSNIEDFELIYWSPVLTRRDESHIHNSFPDRYGEWIGKDKENDVIIALCSLDPFNMKDGCSLKAAKASRKLL